MQGKGFSAPELSGPEVEQLQSLARLCKGDILKMTTLAGCGHPGGSISSLDLYLVLFSRARLDPDRPDDPARDRVLISHGHTSPGAYSVLGRLGFFPVEAAVSGFRRMDTPFEGHVVRELPGLEWSSGNLGQGLSAGCGFAVSATMQGRPSHVFVVMSDGEQAKGQVAEARRFASKYSLENLTVLIDYNHIQISGRLEEVMPQNIRGNYEADGWRVIEIDGHDHRQIYAALREASSDGRPTAILAETVMSRGISFMEGKPAYHGKALKPEECARALEELGLENDLSSLEETRRSWSFEIPARPMDYPVRIETGEPLTYAPGEKVDNRGAFGKALASIARSSCGDRSNTPLAVLDCDLASSVRTEDFAKASPCSFFQVGVQEHNALTVAGALSADGVVSLFAGFGVFGVDETYNQSRLNDLNHANLKIVCTHCGLDVGEDGKTHQCIDYLGLFANLFGFRVVVPADPNQTDRVIRSVLATHGNYLVTMGRSPAPVIVDGHGNPFYAGEYEFAYGKADWLRRGSDLVVITMGSPMAAWAVSVSDRLGPEGISVGVLAVSSPLDLDREALEEAFTTGRVITHEDHHYRTGLGSIVAAALAESGKAASFRRLGVRAYGQSGTPDQLYEREGLSERALEASIREMLSA